MEWYFTFEYFSSVSVACCEQEFATESTENTDKTKKSSLCTLWSLWLDFLKGEVETNSSGRLDRLAVADEGFESPFLYRVFCGAL